MNRNHMFREIGRAISESGMTTGRERRLAIPPEVVNPPRLTAGHCWPGGVPKGTSRIGTEHRRDFR